MATYRELYDYFAKNVDQNGVNSAAWNDRFNQWTVDLSNALGTPPGDWNAIPVGELGNFVYEGGDTTGATAGTPGTAAQELPLEQGLLQTVLPNLQADVAADAQRRALADQLAAQATQANQAAVTALSPEANAARLLEEYKMADETGARVAGSASTSAAEQQAALEQMIQQRQQALTAELASLQGAADAQSQARAAALQTELDKLAAAQAPLSQARLDSANAAAAGVNQGLQSTQDKLTAERAKQGYLGSSSFDDAALARASIGARQQAAQLLGNARELNATDVREIGAHGATEGRSIADQLAAARAGISATGATDTRTLADLLAGSTAGISGTLSQQEQAARDATTTGRQNYFDNAYTRGLSGAMAIPGLESSLAGNLTALDNYANSGLGRVQQALNWWETTPTTAPTEQYVAAQADNSGNQISSLGSSLVGAATKIGNANDWWATPTTIKGIPVANTPSTPSGANWWN